MASALRNISDTIHETALKDGQNVSDAAVYVNYALFGTPLKDTVGSKTVAMFGNFGLIVMQRLTAWKSRLVLVGWSKVLLLGFLSVF
jgi:hypothetical protein